MTYCHSGIYGLEAAATALYIVIKLRILLFPQTVSRKQTLELQGTSSSSWGLYITFDGTGCFSDKEGDHLLAGITIYEMVTGRVLLTRGYSCHLQSSSGKWYMKCLFPTVRWTNHYKCAPEECVDHQMWRRDRGWSITGDFMWNLRLRVVNIGENQTTRKQTLLWI